MHNPALTARILVVDDDPRITRLLQAYLEQERFKVMVAHNGNTALHLMQQTHPHLILLDIMLPDCDGWEITRIVRNDPTLSHTPLILISACVEDRDKVRGFELGADDYITKPFNPQEVIARIKAVLRRTYGSYTDDSPVLEYGSLRMDIAYRNVSIAGRCVELSPTEFQLLKTLMEKPEQTFTRSMLIDHSFGYDYDGMERTLDSHIKNLRKKIEPSAKKPTYIQTVYGVGYRLRLDAG